MKNKKPFERVIRKPVGSMKTKDGSQISLTLNVVKMHSGDNGEVGKTESFVISITGLFLQDGEAATKTFEKAFSKEEADELSKSLQSLDSFYEDYYNGIALNEEVRQSVIPELTFGVKKISAKETLDFLEVASPILGIGSFQFSEERALMDLNDKLRQFSFA